MSRFRLPSRTFSPAHLSTGLVLLAGLLCVFSLGQQMGIHVNLPAAESAVPVPRADKPDSLIVAIDETGAAFSGVTPVTDAALTEHVREHATRDRTEIYVKADEHARYSRVVQVLLAIRAGGQEESVLLTAARPDRPATGIVSPKGLEVSLRPADSQSASVAVDIPAGGQDVRLNNRNVAWTGLRDQLRRLARKRTGRAVSIQADGGVSFEEVARAIDICRAAGFDVVLRLGPQNA